MSAIKLGQVTVELVQAWLTDADRAVNYAVPEPQNLFHGWLTDRYYGAVEGWRNGAPVWLCEHPINTVFWWFPAWPESQLCQPCGQRIRAEMGSFPRPRNHCDVHNGGVAPRAWMTSLEYDTGTWFTTTLACQECVASFGYRTAAEVIESGVDELEKLANSGQG